MRLILDTHLVIWMLSLPDRLGPETRAVIENPDNELLLSAVCLWDIAIKHALRRADFDIPPLAILQASAEADLRDLPVKASAAIRVADLPRYHRDPFDRLLVAQAIDEDALLLTEDRALLAYGSHVNPAN